MFLDAFMTIYGYARVSTLEQSEEYDALKQQVNRIKSAGAEVVLVDIESGRSDTREKFNELLKLVTQGKVREIIITRIDRLGRSGITLGQAMKLFEDNNVKLRILDAPVDASSPFGWHSIHGMIGMAEFESRMLSQRVNHGMAYFRQQQKIAKELFGYILVDQKLILDRETLPIAREIIKKLLAGFSYGAVSKWLFTEHNIKFSLSGLRHWINNPHILGHTRYFSDIEQRRNKKPRSPVIHFNTHEPIATAEEIAQIQTNVKNKRKLSEKTTKNYPLKGLLRCNECGGGMYRIVTKFKSGTQYVRCTKHAQGNHFCTNKITARLENILKQTIEILSTEATSVVKEIESNIEVVQQSDHLVKLQRELAGAESLNSTNPAILAAIADLKTQIFLEENKLKHPTKIDATERFEILRSVSQATFWDSLSEEKAQRFFAVLIETVFVDSSGNVSSIKFSW